MHPRYKTHMLYECFNFKQRSHSYVYKWHLRQKTLGKSPELLVKLISLHQLLCWDMCLCACLLCHSRAPASLYHPPSAPLLPPLLSVAKLFLLECGYELHRGKLQADARCWYWDYRLSFLLETLIEYLDSSSIVVGATHSKRLFS